MAHRWPERRRGAASTRRPRREVGARDRRGAGAARLARPRRRARPARRPRAARGRAATSAPPSTSRGSRASSGRADGGEPAATRRACPGGASPCCASDAVDLEAARAPGGRARARGSSSEIARAEGKLANEGFVAKAPEAGRRRPSATSSTRAARGAGRRCDAWSARARAEEHLLVARAVRHALRAGAHAAAADRARLAAGALPRDPRRRHERQVLDGAHGRGAARGARRAHGRLPLAAPDHVRRAHPDRRRRPRARRVRRRRRSAPRAAAAKVDRSARAAATGSRSSSC